MTALARPHDEFWEPLLDRLGEQLNALHSKKSSMLAISAEAILICKDLLQELQNMVTGYSFDNSELEIHFFKDIKPQFYSRLIFYHKVYHIELGLPVGGSDDSKTYLYAEIQKIKEFFEQHRFIYGYIRSRSTDMDEVFFLRSKKNIHISYTYDIHAHPDFSTNQDYTFSRIKANDLLYNYLQERLSTLQNPGTRPGEAMDSVFKPLQWTESKVALIELIYAWKAKGCFKNGHATLKEISDFAQQVFNVVLTNTSRDFQEILRRKTGYTVYLDDLKESYLNYIDVIESKDRR